MAVNPVGNSLAEMAIVFHPKSPDLVIPEQAGCRVPGKNSQIPFPAALDLKGREGNLFASRVSLRAAPRSCGQFCRSTLGDFF
jgi:hypothetical protein